MAPRKTENNAHAKFGGANKEHYGMLWYFLESTIPVLRHCGSSRHNALFIISEKMASIRRILQTGQTGNLANASYQQPRRVTLKHFVCSFGVMMAWRRILATGFYFLIFTQLLSSVAGQFSLQTVTNYLISDDQ